MSTTLAEHVSTTLRRAGFTASSPELVYLRDWNNRRFAYGAALEAERRRVAELRDQAARPPAALGQRPRLEVVR